MISFFIALTILCSYNYSISHKHYVSITTATINEKSGFIEVSIELSAHDIEYYFEKDMHIQLKLGSKNEAIDSEKNLVDYINKNLIFTINSKLILLDFIGKETLNDESLWIYFEGLLPKHIKSITVKNSILIQSFENQQNILHLEGIIKESHTFNRNFQKKTFYRQPKIKQ